MRKNNWLFYFIYAVVLVFYAIFSNKILISINEQTKRSFDNLPLIIGSMIIFIVLGLLLGLEKFLLETRKKGKWRLNLPKVIFLGVPTLYFSVGIFILYCPIDFIRHTLFYPISYLLKYTDFLSIFQIILGYTIVTSFVKEKN